jgi:ATP-dependent DNA ligase
MADKTKASFISPMLLVRTEKLPEGDNWLYELKLDGFRSIAFKTGGKVHLRSRNDKDVNAKYSGTARSPSCLTRQSSMATRRSFFSGRKSASRTSLAPAPVS